MAKRGQIKVGSKLYTGYAHDYGSKSNPMTAVKTSTGTVYIAQGDQYERRPGESLEQQFKRLAKQADQRMVRLEKLSTQKGFENVEQFAYRVAVENMKGWDGNANFNMQKPRFNRVPTFDTTDEKEYARKMKWALRSRIRDLQTFLRSPTSTKKGIQKVYQNRANEINKKLRAMGTDANFTWQDLANYWESSMADLTDSSFGDSWTRLKAFWSMKKEHESKKEAEKIQKANDQHKIVNTPEDEVKRNLEAAGYDWQTVSASFVF